MIEKNTTQLILTHFFDFPTASIHLRELSRKTGFSMPTILSAIDKLRKENLVTIKKERAWTMLEANAQDKGFIRSKRLHNLEALYETGLVDALQEKAPGVQAIICFGSYSRGEDIETSDIDIALVGAKEFRIPLDIYEKRLKRTISLHWITMEKARPEFRNNIYNGMILEGAL